MGNALAGGLLRGATLSRLENGHIRNPTLDTIFRYALAMDLLITLNDLPPVLLENVGGSKNNWIDLALSGDADSKTPLGTVPAGRARRVKLAAGEPDDDALAGLAGRRAP